MPIRLTADDFFTGIFAAARLEGRRAISIRTESFDRVAAEVFDNLYEEAQARDLDLRFRIRLNPWHGDSSTVRDAISAAVQRDLISLDNPEYQDIRFKFGVEDAATLLAQLPGEPDLYTDLARRFLSKYDAAEQTSALAS